ncbi:unnamed protein product [Linum tenue]|uniref:Uncharacterized protein n=1 Tax=Linum tenue TaxID=586396 RepID=A0AAV0QJV1_9ROSI|nr:unnamed protein product [Linum tenue]
MCVTVVGEERSPELGAQTAVEPEAEADHNPRVHLQLRDGQPSPGRDSQDPPPTAGVRPSGRRQCLLLVPTATTKPNLPPLNHSPLP